MASTADLIRIRYRRPPDREQLFEQRLVQRFPECIVTLLEHTPLRDPIVVDCRVVLEPGSPVVWFTFPGRWHDIGRFHLADGRFTGVYANVLTPVRIIDATTWETTDLFLDVWQSAQGGVMVLDVDELHDATAHAWVTAETAARAADEAAELVAGATSGTWPPAIVRAWPLDRARARVAEGNGTRD